MTGWCRSPSGRRRLWPVLLCVVLLSAACGGSDIVDVDDVAAPETVPGPEAVLADGGWQETAAWIRRENQAGRPVLVNIFASWCGPCRRELPMLIDAHDAHDDVAFLGIDHLDARPDAERFVDEFGIDFPTIYDIGGEVAAAIEGRGMPTTVTFDTEGRLVAHHTGELTEQSLQELLDELA